MKRGEKKIPSAEAHELNEEFNVFTRRPGDKRKISKSKIERKA